MYGQSVPVVYKSSPTSYQGMPVPDYKQYMKMEVDQSSAAGTVPLSRNIEAKEGGRSVGYVVNKYNSKLVLLICHLVCINLLILHIL